jgi:uncharacterized protein YhbP (UPF0306 family)
MSRMVTAPDLESVSALMRILAERHVMTLALTDQTDAADAPYPTPLFFALAQPNSIGLHSAPILSFASDPQSHHGRLTGRGPTRAAAAVYLETEAVGQLRGAQLRGTLLREDCWTATGAASLRAGYLARHAVAEPVLAAGRHRLYTLIVTWAKLTDNRLGFGVHPIVDFDGRCSEVKQSPG